VLDTYYPAFLARHYAERPGLAGRPYAAQLASLIERSFGTSDAYSTGLAAAGHQAVEVVANCWPLQRRWLLERGGGRVWAALPAAPPHRLASRLLRPALERALAAQIAELDPQVVYVQDMSFPSLGLLRRLRSEGRLVAGQIASGAPDEERLRAFDLIVTSFPHFVERFRSLGVDSEYLPLAFDARVIDRLAQRGIDARPHAERPHPVGFAGGLNPQVHTQGTELLEAVAERIDLAVWGYGADALPAGSRLRAAWRGEAWGLDMYAALAQSSIVVNRHIDSAEGFANNMRLFEATGVGALVLTESAPNLERLFEPGSEVVAYDGLDDLIEKLEHYTAADDERAALARRGQQRTLTQHSYEQRMRELAAILTARIG
jgi:hypothetical protein